MNTFPFRVPPLQLVESLRMGDDCVILCAAGFEVRTFALAGIAEWPSAAKAIIIHYSPGAKNNKPEQLRIALGEKGVRKDDTESIEFNRFEPDGFGQRLSARLRASGRERVLLDISSMSKMALLLCLDVCRELNLDVSIFYAEAKRYRPWKTTYDRARLNEEIHQPSIQVYSGVGGVVRARRLSSVAMQGEPVAAIVFMSFNELLTQALLNCIYPSRLFLINGRPPVHAWRELATAWIHEKLRSEWPEEDNPVVLEENDSSRPLRSTSTLFFGETVATMIELYWRLSSDYRVVVAPTGSKMQTVGAFLVRALHSDLHFEYPTPKGYLTLHSSGIGNRWLVRFGRLGTLAEWWCRREKLWRLRRIASGASDVRPSTEPKISPNGS